MEKNFAKCCASSGKIIPLLTLNTVVLHEHVSDNIFHLIKSISIKQVSRIFLWSWCLVFGFGEGAFFVC